MSFFVVGLERRNKKKSNVFLSILLFIFRISRSSKTTLGFFLLLLLVYNLLLIYNNISINRSLETIN